MEEKRTGVWIIYERTAKKTTLWHFQEIQKADLVKVNFAAYKRDFQSFLNDLTRLFKRDEMLEELNDKQKPLVKATMTFVGRDFTPYQPNMNQDDVKKEAIITWEPPLPGKTFADGFSYDKANLADFVKRFKN